MSSRWEFDRSRAGWWVIAAALAAALAYVIYSFIGTFVFGVFIYYATRPVYRRLKSHVRPHSLAAAVALLLLALPVLLLLAYAVAIGLQEANRLFQTMPISQIEALLQPYVDVSYVVQNPEQILNEPSARAIFQTFLNDAMGYLGFIGNILLHLFVMIAIAFYLLRDDQRLMDWFHRRFDDHQGVIVAYASAVDNDFSNIFFGNILNAVLTATIGAVAYSLLNFTGPAQLGIPYPALIGLLAGVASLVPVVGMKLVYVPVAVYLTVVTARISPRLIWFPVTFAAVSFVIVDTIPDFVLRPYVSGRGLHLGMVMLAYIFGPLIWGWYGIFLGPMVLVLVVHFVRLVLPELLAGEPLQPVPVGADLGSTAEPVGNGDAEGDDEPTPGDAGA